MNKSDHWVLPAGIEERLPTDVVQLEEMRRKIFDLFSSWGYELIITPIIEYVESLVIEGDQRLNSQTLKLTDIANGRTMGVRADMTPQAARIDAHRLESDDVRRLCYFGTVVRAKPQDVVGTRELMQFGAEIYGHNSIASTVESIRLAVAALETVGIKGIHINIGHVGIYSALVKSAGLDTQQEKGLFNLIQIKAAHEISDYLSRQRIDSRYQDWFVKLTEAYGDVEILAKAKKLFAGTEAEESINELEEIHHRLQYFGITPTFDLSETGSYSYENGLIFTIYVEGLGQELGHGGRYDNIGKVFGRARPAVGFSSDLLLLASLIDDKGKSQKLVYAPYHEGDIKLQEKVTELRQQGNRVIECLEDNLSTLPPGSKLLICNKGSWVITET